MMTKHQKFMNVDFSPNPLKIVNQEGKVVLHFDEILKEWEELENKKNADGLRFDEEFLELEVDIYCITFLKFRTPDPILHRELLLKSVIAYIMQMMLISLVISETDGFSSAHDGTFKLNCSRLICAFLLHMSLVPEMRCAFSLMNYAKHNQDKFYKQSSLYPFLIGMMKLLGCVTTELVNIFIIIQSTLVSDVIKDFIAFGIIAKIDDMMALSMKNFNVEQEI